MCTGINVLLAKFAARLLGRLREHAACQEIVKVRVLGNQHRRSLISLSQLSLLAQAVLKKFSVGDFESNPACMVSIAELARSAPLALHEQWSLVEAVINQALLPKQVTSFPTEQEVGNISSRCSSVSHVSSLLERIEKMTTGPSSTICPRWAGRRSYPSSHHQ
jgi:hypothetical protein